MKMLMKTKKHSRRSRRLILLILIALILIGLYVYIALFFPLPKLSPTVSYQPASPTISDLTWPSVGEAAVGVYETNIIDTNGSQKPVPTASTAKLLTALSILKIKPLQVGQQGPLITLGPTDVAIYNKYVSEDGSVVPVVSGEQISEYEVLEAMMLPSANNMADSLANWAFGSLSAYSTYANTYAKQLGLNSTHIGSDASGFNPSTTSTPADLVRLGEDALKNPILAQIVSQKTAAGIPVVGTIKNVNQLIGMDNIDGIKTGNSDQAGGVFISSSTTEVGGKQVTLVTALANAPTLYDATYDSLPLITSAQKNFADVNSIDADSIVGSYTMPWGGSVAAIAQKTVTTESWKGTTVGVNLKLNKILTTTQAHQVIGSVIVQKTPFTSQQSTTITLESAIPKPPIWWRLIHPKGLFTANS
jgi:D-alanyl-D-alanine carboxypeptidase (penicillin-binding protein 5/6)